MSHLGEAIKESTKKRVVVKMPCCKVSKEITKPRTQNVQCPTCKRVYRMLWGTKPRFTDVYNVR